MGRYGRAVWSGGLVGRSGGAVLSPAEAPRPRLSIHRLLLSRHNFPPPHTHRKTSEEPNDTSFGKNVHLFQKRKKPYTCLRIGNIAPLFQNQNELPDSSKHGDYSSFFNFFSSCAIIDIMQYHFSVISRLFPDYTVWGSSVED